LAAIIKRAREARHILTGRARTPQSTASSCHSHRERMFIPFQKGATMLDDILEFLAGAAVGSALRPRQTVLVIPNAAAEEQVRKDGIVKQIAKRLAIEYRTCCYNDKLFADHLIAQNLLDPLEEIYPTTVLGLKKMATSCGLDPEEFVAKLETFARDAMRARIAAAQTSSPAEPPSAEGNVVPFAPRPA
jgi:hypothetical protein